MNMEENELKCLEENEAECTWHVGKTIGLKRVDNWKVVQQLRRSQRKGRGV